jgi:hypothetical protein
VPSERVTEEIEAIEETQRALRESIEATKGLAEKAEKLLQQHKSTIEDEAAE